MKKLIKNYFFTVLIISFSTLVSCDVTPDFNDFGNFPSDFSPPDDNQVNTIEDANNELTSKLWKMSNINVGPTNPNFLDYKIKFGQDHTLLATNNIYTYTGTWTVTDSNLNQDVLTELKLNLVFTSPTIFYEMSKNWTFNSISVDYYNGNEIKFHYINNGVVTGSFFLKEIK